MRFSPIPALLPLVLLAACSSQNAPPPAAAAPAGKHVDSATAGGVAGKVVFSGKPPTQPAPKMGADPACVVGETPNPKGDAILVDAKGDVQNVFVYVKDGLDASYTFDVPTAPVVMEQKGCRYLPRVFGVRAGQPIEIVNDDATIHNVHALPKVNQEFNKGQPVQGGRMTHTFTVPETMVRFKCDVHGWMTAYVGVMAHPFFAVTGSDGSFAIKGLPAGTYTIEAWHEQFGSRTETVTISASQTQTVSFTFAAPGQP